MNLEKYDLNFDDDHFTFRFISDGPRGKIQKIVVFTELVGTDNYYNLSFGDWNEFTQKLDDTIISNNLDTPKILSTVAFVAESFLAKRPGAVIFAAGNSAARNRLYRISIAKHLAEINSRFVVRGSCNKKWQSFKKGVSYDAFLLFHK
ncbi:DUF6934 family protein [Dyadobacter fermentans]|uniref:Uncharacterized protein n=1 Tax=Dyadobacter fermentans (strain ATCC 700827 / DSM 18053 / CIP 107007 / KCTC 52180 / NS114) TaxID=471854 RepID=C6VSW0_DYAFD|nr:hypothetical protein [Dyadobacter fermentans]ACT94605.1 conserved hypothetical protein [Dyadobacter fermentans DSM 18053]